MNPSGWIKSRARRPLARLVQAEVQQAMEALLPQWVAFYTSPPEDRQSYYDHTQDPLANQHYYADIRDYLIASGIPVENADIDLADFKKWLDDFSEIKRHYQAGGNQFIEKSLEHYLVLRHLGIAEGDVYIDVGADQSPWAVALGKRGIKAYRLDLAYPPGVNGIDIGANARQTDLPDGFASVISAQNAYEHFMGDADIQFVKEAARILGSEGRYGIVPLYLDDRYYVATSPYFDQRTMMIEGEAKRVWRDDGLKISFSRHYSPESFRTRIFSAIPPTMKGKVLYFRNLTEVMLNYPGQRIYCYFMFVCEQAVR